MSVAIQHINSIPLSRGRSIPTIPEALEAITMKAMAPNPDNRYADAGRCWPDLEEFRKNPNINFDYNVNEFPIPEEPDEDKTRSVPSPPSTGGAGAAAPIASAAGSPGPTTLPYEEDEDEPEPRGPRLGHDRRGGHPAVHLGGGRGTSTAPCSPGCCPSPRAIRCPI
ncbi:MAG: hypothetical protein V8S34_08085 [Lawsonibacter sp.]